MGTSVLGIVNTSPDGNAHRFRTPQISEQQPFNLPNPESAGKIISGTPLLGNSHCWERGCKRAGPSPKNLPTNKIFLPKIPRLGADGFHSFNALRPAQFTCFSLFKKPPVAGRKILWVGHNHPPTSDPAKKRAVKDGDFCFRHFLHEP